MESRFLLLYRFHSRCVSWVTTRRVTSGRCASWERCCWRRLSLLPMAVAYTRQLCFDWVFFPFCNLLALQTLQALGGSPEALVLKRRGFSVCVPCGCAGAAAGMGAAPGAGVCAGKEPGLRRLRPRSFRAVFSWFFSRAQPWWLLRWVVPVDARCEYSCQGTAGEGAKGSVPWRCHGGAVASPGPAQEPAAEQPDGSGGSVPEGRASPERRNACERSHLCLPKPKEMFVGIKKGQNACAGPSTPNGRISPGWMRMLQMLLRN